MDAMCPEGLAERKKETNQRQIKVARIGMVVKCCFNNQYLWILAKGRMIRKRKVDKTLRSQLKRNKSKRSSVCYHTAAGDDEVEESNVASRAVYSESIPTGTVVMCNFNAKLGEQRVPRTEERKRIRHDLQQPQQQRKRKMGVAIYRIEQLNRTAAQFDEQSEVAQCYWEMAETAAV
ncbi:unnamed protein product [Gongylonema pulchrum]|uniref:Uncharacterized protein n=1 Tax=Gongylonema pulchrum TaxID=637853 RepID=A0A183DPS0_9BILA|nr:unnamed protein product [Gongylonema pulchrum]